MHDARLVHRMRKCGLHCTVEPGQTIGAKKQDVADAAPFSRSLLGYANTENVGNFVVIHSGEGFRVSAAIFTDFTRLLMLADSGRIPRQRRYPFQFR